MSRYRLDALGLPLALLAACSSEPASLTETRESEHFRVHSVPGDPEVCDETLEELERNRSVVSRFLDLRPPDRLEYYKFAGALEEGFCPGTSMCQRRGNIFTNQPLHVHELVHGYLWTLGDYAFFTGEGLATAIDCDSMDVSSWEPLVGGWQDARPEANPYESYPIARALLSHLLRRCGPTTALEWYQATPDGASNEQLASTFAQVFAADISDEFEVAVVEPPCTNVIECAGDPLPLDQPIVFRASNCTQRIPTYTVTANERRWLRWSSPDSSRLGLLGCISAPGEVTPTPPPISLATVGARKGFFLLTPGKYALSSRPSNELRAWWEDGPFSSTDCSLAEPHAPEAEGDSLELFLPPEATTQFVRLAPVAEPARSPRVTVAGRSRYARVSACRSCADDDCVLLNESDESTPGTVLPDWPGWTLRIEDLRPTLGVGLLVRY